MSRQTTFTGANRRALVNELERRFNDVRSTGTPRWVSLEAPLGWGKTRIIQEFYRKLAAQQKAPRYWPDNIEDAADEHGHSNAFGRRKRIYPQAWTKWAGARPEWFWWGMTCHDQVGDPLSSLRNDLRQFEIHKQSLLDSWTSRTTKTDRIKDSIQHQGGLAHAIASDAVSFATSIPALSVAEHFLKKTAAVIARTEDKAKRTAYPVTVNISRHDEKQFVDEIATSIGQLARYIPIIIAIEDFHYASLDLLWLLRELLNSEDSQIFVITTAWPGLLDQESVAATTLARNVDPTRSIRISTEGIPGVHDDETCPSFERLDTEDLISILRELLPGLPRPACKQVVAHWPQPLALELLSELTDFRRAADGAFEISSNKLNYYGSTLDDLFLKCWERLDPDVQHFLAFAAQCIPFVANHEYALGDTRFDTAFVVYALQRFHQDDANGDNAAADWTRLLAESPAAASWLQESDDGLMRFSEPAMRNIAARSREQHFGSSDLQKLYAWVTEYISDVPSSGSDTCLDRLLITLFVSGRSGSCDRSVTDAVMRCVDLNRQSNSVATARDTLRLVALILTRLNSTDPDVRFTKDGLLAASAEAYLLNEEPSKAVEVLEKLIESAESNQTSTLAIKGTLATAYLNAGMPAEAAALLETIWQDSNVINFAGFERFVLSIRHELGNVYRASGKPNEAINILASLLEDSQLVIKGEPGLIAIRNSLAIAYLTAGDSEKAIETLRGFKYEKHAESAIETLDLDSVLNNLAIAENESGYLEKAIETLERSIDSTAAISDEDDPDLLIMRANLASFYHDSGRIPESLHLYSDVISIMSRTFGANHPRLLITQSNYCDALLDSGETSRALIELGSVVSAMEDVLHCAHPRLLLARNNLAASRWVAAQPTQVGVIDAAISEFEMIVSDCENLLEASHPYTLTAQTNLAAVYRSKGRIREAVDLLERVVERRLVIPGPGHLLTLRTRRSLALYRSFIDPHGSAGVVRELEDVVRVSETSLGRNHRDTIIARDLLDKLRRTA